MSALRFSSVPIRGQKSCPPLPHPARPALNQSRSSLPHGVSLRLDHIVLDRTGLVAEDARAIRMLRQRVPVVAFVNNHFAGYAPETARQLVAVTG